MLDSPQYADSQKIHQKVEFASVYDSLYAQMMQDKQNKSDLKAVQRKSHRHKKKFHSMYEPHYAATVAAQNRANLEAHYIRTVQTEGIGAAAAALTGGIAKAAIGTAKLAGKAAVVAGKAAVVAGKAVANATVKAEKAAQKSVVPVAKSTKKGVMAVEKKAIKALKHESKSHEDSEPQGTIDSPDYAKTFVNNTTPEPTPVT